MGLFVPVKSEGAKVRTAIREAQMARLAERSNLRAHYDNAQTDNLNSRHWANADSLSPIASNSLSVRMTLRDRARYESANNGYALGMLLSESFNVVGRWGPRLQMRTGEEEVDTEIELNWAQWTRAIILARKLRTMWTARRRDGEAFAQIFTNRGLKYPVQLDLWLPECDRVTDPTLGLVCDNKNVDGIIYDEFGNPTEYYILKQHPGSLNRNDPDGFNIVDAAFVLHTFRHDRPEQRRGVTEMLPTLGLFAQLRRWTIATLHAAETAADHALVIHTDAAADDADAPAVMDTFELDPKLATVLPDGYDISQVKNEQPPTSYKEFKRGIISEVGRAMTQPYNRAAGDSSDYNYASGRLDHQDSFKAEEVMRGDLEDDVVEPIYKKWSKEAALAGNYLSIAAQARLDAPHDWLWRGQEHVDPAKEAKAQKDRLSSGTTTIPLEYARAGHDYAVEFVKGAKALGVSVEVFQGLIKDSIFKTKGGAGAPGATAEDVQEAVENVLEEARTK